MKRSDLILGVPLVPLLIVGFVTVLMVFDFGQLAFFALAAVAWIILKIITDKDEWLLDIVLASLFQPDRIHS
jgi:type IV secretory pathway VirB3-like protein